MKRKKNQRCVYEITVYTEHYLANLLAMTKILGFSLSKAKVIAKKTIGKPIGLQPPLCINSELSTDEILMELDEYQIQVKITNI